jgi:hypothetical protein
MMRIQTTVRAMIEVSRRTSWGCLFARARVGPFIHSSSATNKKRHARLLLLLLYIASTSSFKHTFIFVGRYRLARALSIDFSSRIRSEMSAMDAIEYWTISLGRITIAVFLTPPPLLCVLCCCCRVVCT